VVAQKGSTIGKVHSEDGGGNEIAVNIGDSHQCDAWSAQETYGVEEA
jgi:hypothetical protein